MADERIKREPNEGRDSRALLDRPVVEDRVLNDADRLALLRQGTLDEVLPTPPEIPGHHTCWVSTTHPTDTVVRRVRLGYSFVKPEEVKGLASYGLKTGTYAGCIGINEMLLMKLPRDVFEQYMTELHHNQPLREEESIRYSVEQMREKAGVKSRIIDEGGMLQSSTAPRPDFSGLR